MNKLILLGNGFDLAHGLKTSYNDFILWYINKSIIAFRSTFSFVDDLMEITSMNSYPLNGFKSLKEFHAAKSYYTIQYKNGFFADIVNHGVDNNWVDIESKYYNALVVLYKSLEKQDRDSHPQITVELEKLNHGFNCIKTKLTEYLLTVDNKLGEVNEEINLHLFKESLNARLEVRNSPHRNKSKILILNFNYTSTIEKYIDTDPENPITVNYIHGKLGDINNPVIFGYGDEMHHYYEKIERLNSNEFLKNFKSFGYFKTRNYQELSRFITSEIFDVQIMGHSCGLSDRILLNSIFEHKNCRQIKIFYHQKNEKENDHFEKTQEISRHFKADAKSEMRKKIVPFSDSVPLTKYKS